MSMAARASKRAQNALNGGIGGRGSDGGVSALPNGKGQTYTMTNGSTINWGGDDKFGLYPTVGVSVGFLNILSSCCDGRVRSGVNTSSNWNEFLNF